MITKSPKINTQFANYQIYPKRAPPARGVQTDRSNWFWIEPLNFGLFSSIFSLKILVRLKFLANLIFIFWFCFDFSKSDKLNSPKLLNKFILLDINKDYIKDNPNIFIFYKFYLVFLSIFIIFDILFLFK